MGETNITWAQKGWSPVTGCTPVSEGCQHCWAKKLITKRMMHVKRYSDGFNVTYHADRLVEPLKWKRPQRVFVAPMGDLFHEQIPFHYIATIFQVMLFAKIRRELPHTFLILTKRAKRMSEFIEWFMTRYISIYERERPAWPDDYPHVWLGVTAENQARADERISILLQTPAIHRFASCEPLLGWIDIKRFLLGDNSIEWLIASGESGLGFRFMEPNWARQLRDQCFANRVPFFFKQHAARQPNKGPLLDRVKYDAAPPF